MTYIIDYNHVKQVILEPLISGIIMILLSYYDVKIFIKADMLFSVNAHYMFLKSPIRMELVKLMKNGIKIKYNCPSEIVDDEVKICSEFIFIKGIGAEQYVKITSEAEMADAHERYRETISKQLQNTFTAFAHRKYAIIAVAEHIFCDCCI
jgi:hypothetical protein